MRAAFAAAGLALALAACTPPGKGPRAAAEYRRAAPVLAALEGYRARQGQYPERLEALVPAWLPAGTLAVRPPFEPLEYPLGRDSSFTLTFRYTGPGRNQCSWNSATPRWRCSGYF